MPTNDILFVFIWWMVLLLITFVNYPLTVWLFSRFIDRGYIFAKILGILLLSYIVFVLGIFHIAPFTLITVLIVLSFLTFINLLIVYLNKNTSHIIHHTSLIIIEEFLFLGILLFWSYVRAHQPAIEGLEKLMDYGFVKSILASRYFPPQDMWLATAKLPDKTPEMFKGFYINYYYFGHLVTAVLTRLSQLPPAVTYNLQIASLTAFTFAGSFSLGINLFASSLEPRALNVTKKILMAGILTAFLVTFSGNLHTIYSFTPGYQTKTNELPPPPWSLQFDTVLTDYWYPNATRFIPYTIHEFPSYSSIVADLHGHFSNIPFVLLMLAVLLNLLQRSETWEMESAKRKWEIGFFDILKNFARAKNFKKSKSQKVSPQYQKLRTSHFALLLIGFLLAIFYMTNSWDTLVYGLLSFTILLIISGVKYRVSSIKFFTKLIQKLLVIIITFVIFSLPFSYFFHPFSSKIGVNCGYGILDSLGITRLFQETPASIAYSDLPAEPQTISIGPFLFEPNDCQKTPLWMHFILWGFFYYAIFGFIIFILWPRFTNGKWEVKALESRSGISRILDKVARVFLQSNYQKITHHSRKAKSKNHTSHFSVRIPTTEIFLVLLILISLFLLWIPEFFYIKDIYPAHFRANTMFKLGYQAFIMLSLVAGYTIARIFNFQPACRRGRFSIFNFKKKNLPKILYVVFLIPQLLLISIYPLFGINSYYNGLRIYRGLYGLNWLRERHPDDYNGVLWLDGQTEALCKSDAFHSIESVAFNKCPVILEAVGDSYTEYARVSANTGLPTVLGWPVHEWLWRGSYDEAGKRKGEIETIYTSQNTRQVKDLFTKYGAEYIFVGELEREKYPKLTEKVFQNLGTVVYQSGETKIYQLISTSGR